MQSIATGEEQALRILQVSKRSMPDYCYRFHATFFLRNNVNVLDYYADYFELSFVDKHGSSYRG